VPHIVERDPRRRGSSWSSNQENVMRKLLLSSISLLVFTSASFADGTETVVVTATRTPQPASVTGVSIDVITAKDLETRQIDVVTDILQATPGLMVNRNGGVGQLSTVSLRGAEAGQTVALIDGIRINDPSAPDNTAIFGDLLVNNIDRIEILRGPQSTLYGSDAIGGVVNVITKRGGTGPLDVIATAEGGALDTVHLDAAANGSSDRIDYGAGLDYYNTRSISAADSRNGNPEPDPYRHYGATANTRIHIDDALSVDLRAYYVRGHTSFDDNFEFIPPSTFEVADSRAFNTNELFAGYGGANYDLFNGALKNRIAVIATSSTRKFFNSFFDPAPGELDSADYGDALRFEYQGIVEPTDIDEITFGVETERTAFRGNTYGFFANSDAGHNRTTGYYLQEQHRFFDQLTLTGGVRLEDDDQFGAHVSTKVAAAWQIPGWDTTLRGNYDEGFKAPSLFQRFSEFSNPSTTLKPETAHGWEVGIDKSLLNDRLRASLVYFDRHTTNLIDFVPCSGMTCIPRPFGFYENVGRALGSGFEAEIRARPTDDLTLSANYTNLTAIDRTSGLALARRPRIKENAVATWSPNTDIDVGGSVTYVGSRFDDAGGSVRLPGFVLINLFGSWQVSNQYQLFARVENLFDKHYEPVFGFGEPGRTMFAGIRVRG
jgi:vitamin B12 transporter